MQTKLICLKQKTDLFTVLQMKHQQYPQENINILFCSVLSWMDKMDLVCLEATFSFYEVASYRWLFLVQSLADAALLFLLLHNYSFSTWPHNSCYYTLSTLWSFSPQAEKDLDISVYQCRLSTLYYHKISLVLFVFCDVILLKQTKLVQCRLSPSGPTIFFHHCPGSGSNRM